MLEERTIGVQERHYEAIHDAYAAHYYDAVSNAYRQRFILGPLLKGQNLNTARIAELACGDGHNSLLLKEQFPEARIEGIDISEPACASFRTLTGFAAHKADLTAPFDLGQQFDAVLIIGGLHHCVLDLPATMDNIARLVRPGGVFMAYEPNAKCWLESIRRLWYRADRYFDAATERSLTVQEIESAADGRFKLERAFYVGGPAYFLLIQSLITRFPRGWKKPLQAPLFALESAWNSLPGKVLFPAFGSVWRRVN